MLYADAPTKRALQLTADAIVLLWCIFWVLVGKVVYDAISLLEAPAKALDGASSGLSDQLDKTGGSLPNVISGPFRALANSADSLSEAAASQSDQIGQLAWIMATVIGGPPIFFALLIAVPLRLRWVREASSASQLQSTENFEELMARRAIVRQPLRRLRAVSNDPIGDIETGNFAALADLEVRRLGLRSLHPRNRRFGQLGNPPS